MIDSDFDFPANFTFAVCRLPFSTRRIAITYVDNATTVYYASIYLCFLIVVHVSGRGEFFLSILVQGTTKTAWNTN